MTKLLYPVKVLILNLANAFIVFCVHFTTYLLMRGLCFIKICSGNVYLWDFKIMNDLLLWQHNPLFAVLLFIRSMATRFITLTTFEHFY